MLRAAKADAKADEGMVLTTAAEGGGVVGTASGAPVYAIPGLK